MRKRTDFDADALLAGRLPADDVPPSLVEVAQLIRAARASTPVRKLANEERLVSTVASVVREARAVPDSVVARPRRVLGMRLSVKATAFAAALLLTGGAAAAAATGALPASLQTGVAHGLAHLGITVPRPASHPVASPLPRAGNAGRPLRSPRRSEPTATTVTCAARLQPSDLSTSAHARGVADPDKGAGRGAAARSHCKGSPRPSSPPPALSNSAPPAGAPHGSAPPPTLAPPATGPRSGNAAPKGRTGNGPRPSRSAGHRDGRGSAPSGAGPTTAATTTPRTPPTQPVPPTTGQPVRSEAGVTSGSRPPPSGSTSATPSSVPGSATHATTTSPTTPTAQSPSTGPAAGSGGGEAPRSR